MPYRAWVKHESGPFRPSTLGNRAESGTRTFKRDSSDVTDARKLNFPWISDDEKPSISFSTKKPCIICSSSFAHITATSAIEPLVIHVFEPLRIQSLPSRTAFVTIPPGLEPKLASVKPKQPINFPEPSPGNHFCFC